MPLWDSIRRLIILRWLLRERNPNPDTHGRFPQLPLRLRPKQPRALRRRCRFNGSRPWPNLTSFPNSHKIQETLLILPPFVLQLNRSPHFRPRRIKVRSVHPTLLNFWRIIILRPWNDWNQRWRPKTIHCRVSFHYSRYNYRLRNCHHTSASGCILSSADSIPSVYVQVSHCACSVASWHVLWF